MENELGHIDENLLVKYLAGEATEGEISQIETWLKEEKNRKEFDALSLVWNQAGEATSLPKVDVDAAWSKVQGRMGVPKKEPVIRHISGKKRMDTTGINWFLKIAAAFIPLAVAVLGVWEYTNREVPWITMESGDSRIERVLPDGSVVTLSKNSVFKYPAKFKKAHREVALNGEAFFEVERDEQHPFVIHTDKADVRVLGTSFNVNAYEGNDAAEVIVETGKVAFYVPEKKNEEYVELERGDKAVLNKTEEVIESMETSETEFYSRKTRTLVFERTEMDKVIEVLNSIYRIDIQLSNEEIANCRLTATFRNQDIASILDVIGETFNLQVYKKGKDVKLEGDGCGTQEVN